MPDINASVVPASLSNMDMHAPRGYLVDSDTAQSQVDNETEETVKMIRDMMDQGKAARQEYDSDWDMRLQYYKDNQWDKRRPSYKASPVLNIIRSTIQSTLPILTDAKPGFNVLPEEPQDYDFGLLLGDLTASWWDRQTMDFTLIETLMDSQIYDAGILKVIWDPTAENNAGEITATPTDPRDIFIPFGARDFQKDCPWVLHRVTRTVGELKIQFPEKAKDIKPDTGSSDKAKNDSINTAAINLVSPQDKKGTNVQTFNNASGDQRKTCEVWELWMDSDEVVEYEAEDNTTQFKKKYPRGLLITYLPNCNCLLQKIENPYRHAKKPFVRFIDAILPRSLWGEGEVKSLMPQQRLINKALANIIDYSNMVANPVWVTEQGNGVDPDSLTNQIGGVIVTTPGKGNTVRRDMPPAMQPGAIEIVQWLLRQSEMISGSSEVSQGRKPAGVSAAAAIESLQEAAQTRIRLKERNMNVSIGQLGKMVIELMMQFYSEPRVARLTGKDKAWPEYFEFYIEQTEDGKLISNKKKYTFDETNKTYTPDQRYKSSQPSKGIFDVKILSGTSLPQAKTQRANVAFRLFDSKAIDQPELLEALEWPNKEKVMQRMNPPTAQAQAGQPEQAGPTPGMSMLPTTGGPQ